MVAVHQDIRHGEPAIDGRARVLGRLEKAVLAERLARRGGRAASQHAGKKPHDGIDHCGHGNFAARQDKIAHRHLVRDEPPHPLVNALIVSAEENEVLRARKILGRTLRVGRAGGGGEHHARAGRADDLDRLRPHVGTHQHAGAAGVGLVVHRATLVAGEVAQVHCTNKNLSHAHGTGKDALTKKSPEHLGEDGDDVNPHYFFTSLRTALWLQNVRSV